MLDLTFVVINFNTPKLTLDCLASIEKYCHGLNYEVIVIDNASHDDSPKVLKNYTKSKANMRLILNSDNLGFAKANNQGVTLGKGRYLLLLNSDTLLTTSFIKDMLAWMDKDKKVGIASCKLVGIDGKVQGNGGYFPTLLSTFSWMLIQDIPGVDLLIKPFHPLHKKSFMKGEDFYNSSKELDWLTGAFFLIRKEVIDSIGMLDEDYFMYAEDLDYCYRAKTKGWKIYYKSDWQITHFGGASGTSEFTVLASFAGMLKFYKKHYPSWQYPFFRLILKVGTLGRALLFGILEGLPSAKIYVKAFNSI